MNLNMVLLILILLAGIILLCGYFYERRKYKKGDLSTLLIGLFDIIYAIFRIILMEVIK